MSGYYSGKRVFITGGSSGIGKSIALMLAEQGAHLYIAARGQARLDEALAEIREHAANADQVFGSVALDVSDRDAVKDAAEKVVSGLGGIDIVVNNAGIAHPASIMDTPDEVFDSMMAVNYFGTVHVTRAFLPYMTEARGGTIAIVSSLAGVLGIYGYSAYSASKFALWGFADCVRQDVLKYGIKVCVVFPPDTDTPQLEEENRIKPPETKAIAGNVKVQPPEFVAKALLEGVKKGKYHVIPGMGSKFTYFMARHFPAITRWVIDGDLKKYQRRADA